MAEVLFYHLTESTLEDALPGLLERSARARLARGGADRHARSGATRSTRICGPFATIRSWRTAPIASPMPADQPVLLTTGTDNANGAQIRFLVDGAAPPDARRLRARGVHVRRPRRGAGRGGAGALEDAEGRGPRRDLLAADARQAMGAQGVTAASSSRHRVRYEGSVCASCFS